jgi:hypothetical protein
MNPLSKSELSELVSRTQFHTPGDWHAIQSRFSEDLDPVFIVGPICRADLEDVEENSGRETICIIDLIGPDATIENPEEGRANAELIASAPRLLATALSQGRVIERLRASLEEAKVRLCDAWCDLVVDENKTDCISSLESAQAMIEEALLLLDPDAQTDFKGETNV